MNSLRAGSLLAAAAVLVFVAPATAQSFSDYESHQVASGACQPFVPTTDVRYNQSGLTNAGSATIYVVCSLAGSSYKTIVSGNLAYAVALHAANNSSATKTLSCTARPGVLTPVENKQLAFPRSSPVLQGETKQMAWTSDDFSNGVSGNVNLTCALPAGFSLHYIEVDYQLRTQ